MPIWVVKPHTRATEAALAAAVGRGLRFPTHERIWTMNDYASQEGFDEPAH